MNCNLCPRECNIDRSKAQGFCGAGDKLRVARAALHYWEEPCISGSRGSGTVFFSGCNMRCVYCQNYGISNECFGKDISEYDLEVIFNKLIESGAHNINLVTPDHYADVIARVLRKFDSPVPVVYNTSSYCKTETIKLLEGLVDIYLADIKYYDSSVSAKYSSAPDYYEKAEQAVSEMYRQTGNLVTDDDGIAKKGLIIRHLVLPGNVSQVRKIFENVACKLGTDVFVSLMSQYIPEGKACEYDTINRKLSKREYELAKKTLLGLGFENCYFQDMKSADKNFIPDFDLEGVDI